LIREENMKQMEKDERDKEREEQDKRLAEAMAKVRHKFLVLSGKGGVGKTTVAVNLAMGFAMRGYEVGLLDVDIHGPNVPKMLGIQGQMLEARGKMIVPIHAAAHLKVISMATLLPDPDSPVIWRGPLKMGAIKQFLSDVNWGELDFMIVDCPPGTGDEPLSTAQLIPKIDGGIIVTTPQEVALLDSRKCVNFVRQLKLTVTGIVENMSGLICPHCGKNIELFKTGGGEKAAEQMGVPFLGRLPIEPEIVISGDEGKPFLLNIRKSETAKKIDEIVDNILGSLNNKENGTHSNQSPKEART
jgi:ATP-binding protein involved in chromosome partitioning